MKIAIVTHLYPPDIAEPAPYVKELARRLSLDHNITVVSLGTLPENVERVHHIPISKSTPLLKRLASTYTAVTKVAKENDLLIVENGASVSLPTAVASFLNKTPVIFHEGDTNAKQLAQHSRLLGFIDSLAKRTAAIVLTDMPLPRPERHPFISLEDAALDAYEDSWKDHISTLHKHFNHVKK